MFEFFRKLLSSKPEPKRPEPMDILRKTGSFPSQQKKQSNMKTRRPQKPLSQQGKKEKKPLPIRIEDGGPGKNVLQRTRYVREDTGTHETLKIVDENGSEEHGESGIDPYNTGQFDRSKTWGKHFNK